MAKINNIIQIDGDGIRDSMDARDRFELLRKARSDARHKFGGSMKFESRGHSEYLIRRPHGSSTRLSCGRRSPETEATLAKIQAGKARVQELTSSLRRQLDVRAPILRARGLGRVPILAARILRKLDDLDWLGTSLTVLGTNAIYAYEARAAVRIATGSVATASADMLHDSRRRLVMSGNVDKRVLVRALRTVDRSFQRTTSGTSIATNKDGYCVDLIEPQGHERRMLEDPASRSEHLDDLLSAKTESSGWRLDSPKFEAIAFDVRGLPLRIVTIDPRFFALQKQWIVENDLSHDPHRRIRDEQQARVAAIIATRHLGLSFDDQALSALPKSLRNLADRWNELPPEQPSPW